MPVCGQQVFFLSIYICSTDIYLLWVRLCSGCWDTASQMKGIAVLEFLVGGAPELRLPAPVLRPDVWEGCAAALQHRAAVTAGTERIPYRP